MPEAGVRAWGNSERTGQCARRTGFLWEWLSGRELEDVPGAAAGNYVDAIDPERYMASTAPANNGRWRVRDNNLPGSRAPVARLSDAPRRSSMPKRMTAPPNLMRCRPNTASIY